VVPEERVAMSSTPRPGAFPVDRSRPSRAIIAPQDITINKAIAPNEHHPFARFSACQREENRICELAHVLCAIARRLMAEERGNSSLSPE
jgi:hypothetical protein